MAMDNNVTITGNATREPELRFTPSGQPVANFGVAVVVDRAADDDRVNRVTIFERVVKAFERDHRDAVANDRASSII